MDLVVSIAVGIAVHDIVFHGIPLSDLAAKLKTRGGQSGCWVTLISVNTLFSADASSRCRMCPP